MLIHFLSLPNAETNTKVPLINLSSQRTQRTRRYQNIIINISSKVLCSPNFSGFVFTVISESMT